MCQQTLLISFWLKLSLAELDPLRGLGVNGTVDELGILDEDMADQRRRACLPVMSVSDRIRWESVDMI
jgi:hypothetical protein